MTVVRLANAINALIFVCFYFIRGASGNMDYFKAELVCTKTHMNVYVTYTDGPFTGVVYTEGSYKDPHCYQQIDQSSKFLFQIPYDGCKTVLEKGKYTNVMVVQHHQRIMTADDAAMKLSCDQSNYQQGAEVKVTETMHMMDKDEEPLDKSELSMKPYYKKEKTILTDKGVMTFANTSKNHTNVKNQKSSQI